MKNSRWHSCNVLAPGAGERRVWKFRAAQNGVSEESVISVRDADPLPQNLVKKTWQTIWQGKLNVAWLPAGRVFLKAFRETNPNDPLETQPRPSATVAGAQ